MGVIMITINKNEIKKLEKYYTKEITSELIDNLVDELAELMEKSSGLEVEIFQDIDNPNYYRLYAGCSAVEVYLENNRIQIDFDIGWQLSSNNQLTEGILEY